MGAMASPLGTIGTVLGGLSTAYSAYKTFAGPAVDYASQQQQYKYDRERLNLELQQRQENAELQKQQVAEQAKQADRKRRDALKRAVARQRAISGGQGISSANGSSEAILLGLFDESETELAERERLDSLKSAAYDLDVSQNARLNVLQKTQLQQNNKFDTLKTILNATS
ncbi:MAG: transporter [Alphaproteobacteria bacterium]|nr:transporter [Alphaproteobacteria bacterium]